jgi:hypothetical protein
MAALWGAKPQATGVSGSSVRSQMLCLTAYLDQDTATRAAYLSAARSRACRYHPYEPAPTATELTRLLNEATDLVTDAGTRPNVRIQAGMRCAQLPSRGRRSRGILVVVRGVRGGLEIVGIRCIAVGAMCGVGLDGGPSRRFLDQLQKCLGASDESNLAGRRGRRSVRGTRRDVPAEAGADEEQRCGIISAAPSAWKVSAFAPSA